MAYKIYKTYKSYLGEGGRWGAGLDMVGIWIGFEWGFGWNAEGMGNFWRKCCEKY